MVGTARGPSLCCVGPWSVPCVSPCARRAGRSASAPPRSPLCLARSACLGAVPCVSSDPPGWSRCLSCHWRGTELFLPPRCSMADCHGHCRAQDQPDSRCGTRSGGSGKCCPPSPRGHLCPRVPAAVPLVVSGHRTGWRSRGALPSALVLLPCVRRILDSRAVAVRSGTASGAGHCALPPAREAVGAMAMLIPFCLFAFRCCLWSWHAVSRPGAAFVWQFRRPSWFSLRLLAGPWRGLYAPGVVRGTRRPS